MVSSTAKVPAPTPKTIVIAAAPISSFFLLPSTSLFFSFSNVSCMEMCAGNTDQEFKCVGSMQAVVGYGMCMCVCVCVCVYIYTYKTVPVCLWWRCEGAQICTREKKKMAREWEIMMNVTVQTVAADRCTFCLLSKKKKQLFRSPGLALCVHETQTALSSSFSLFYACAVWGGNAHNTKPLVLCEPSRLFLLYAWKKRSL